MCFPPILEHATPQSMPEKPGRIKLVHGEPEVQKILRNKLNQLGYEVTERSEPCD
ncbi:hypothetical protein ES703_41993 [subsurface metagenome]